ncbi:MAG: efflux transporter outer membrane subunit [Flavobacteriaceae bacterium]|jgi:NodT family efflux transporter outer membrane factor (OMF) lipoprotein|nr:efflux transporter outer membrane subunit [Flavobacteriaceae bacterium]MCB0485373.1 efflux transporter outer membrane subunit [Flavobacteriaceae bacterium]
MKKYILKFSSIILLGLLLQSCLAVKEYERPVDVVATNYFRTDQLSADSLSVADFSWKEIFRDSLLQQYIERGLTNNLDIRNALQNIAIAEAYLKQSKAAYLPTLAVNSQVSRSTSSLNTQFGQIIGQRVYLTQFDITASASWEVDVWGKLNSAEKASKAGYLQTVAAHQAVKSQIVSGIASAYFQLLTLDEQKGTTLKTIAIREKNLSTTKALKDAGIVSEVAVKQTNAQLINAKSSLIDIDNSINIVENQLSILMGEHPHSIARKSLQEQYVPDDIKTGYPMDLLRNRPDVIAAEMGLIQAFQLTNVAQLNMYPSFKLSATAGLQSVDFSHLFSAQSFLGSLVGGITQPIFQKRQLKTQKEVAEAQQEQALINFRKSLLTAGQEVSNALLLFTTQDEIIQYKEEEYKEYQLAAKYSKELLNHGMVNYLEVLNAEQNALNAQLISIQAQYTKLNALVQLYNALGGGWK